MKDSVPLDRSLVKVLEEYQDVSDQLKDMEKRKTGLSNQLKAALGEHEEGKFDNGQIVRWKRIEKEDLYIRIVSTNKKVTVLERGIYRKIGDIILGVYLRINEDDGKLYTTLIDNTYLDKWELSKEDVLEQAMDNTVKMAPPRFYDGMQLKLAILTGRYGGIPIKEFSPTENERRDGCFLSTDKKTNGATAVFYPGVARKICEAYGTEAVYIVPTSIHEVAIHDIRYTEDVEMLSKCLEAVTEDSTPEDEVASSHIFMYELKTDKITEVM